MSDDNRPIVDKAMAAEMDASATAVNEFGYGPSRCAYERARIEFPKGGEEARQAFWRFLDEYKKAAAPTATEPCIYCGAEDHEVVDTVIGKVQACPRAPKDTTVMLSSKALALMSESTFDVDENGKPIIRGRPR